MGKKQVERGGEMGTAAGIWSHAAAGASHPGVTAMASSTGSTSSSSSSDSATISANDFLTLLVTEMQNQDPTADTDPNEYINQLVNVNSLEQLININQTLSAAYPSSSSTGTSGTNGDATGGIAGTNGVSSISSGPTGNSVALNQESAAAHASPQQQASQFAPGNLSIPAGNPAAQRVAHSLSGQ
jgi:flagellar basal-body rod modification protein FlgD